MPRARPQTPEQVALAPGLTASSSTACCRSSNDPHRHRLERRARRVGAVGADPSVDLLVVGVSLERWDLAGEQPPVLGIPVDRFE